MVLIFSGGSKMKRTLIVMIMAAGSAVSLVAQGADLSQAEALYQKRGEGFDAAMAAKQAYEAQLDALSGQELISAMGRIGELYLYAGSMATDKSDKAKRLQVFGECEKAMERINPATVGENPQYYYFKAACVAYYAESGSLLDKLARVDYFKKGKDKDLIYTAIEKGFNTFMAGGVYRTGAGVYSNQQASLVGLYNPEEAISMTKAALALPADAENHTGEDFCENHRYLAQAYLGLKNPDKAGAATALNHAIEYFVASREAGVINIEYLPEGLEPETKTCVKWIYEMKDANGI
jgi:hypothetical protein